MRSLRVAALVAASLVAGWLMTFTSVEAAEEYDITACGAGTITTLSTSEELTILGVDTKGIARSNGEKKAFDNTTYHCVGVMRIVRGQRGGSSFCRYVDTDGDAVVGEAVLGPTEGTWRFLEGTGKWKGITGGGKNWPVTSARPVLPGTAQACARATGSYEVQK